MDFEAISRRDFLKRTTVLTVGLTSVQLFAGIEDLGLLFTLYLQYSEFKKCEGSIERSEPYETNYFDEVLLMVTCTAPACMALLKPVCGLHPKETNGIPDRDANGNFIMEEVRVKCGDSSELENNQFCMA